MPSVPASTFTHYLIANLLHIVTAASIVAASSFSRLSLALLRYRQRKKFLLFTRMNAWVRQLFPFTQLVLFLLQSLQIQHELGSCIDHVFIPLNMIKISSITTSGSS